MDIFDIFTILITFSALFGYLNYRYFHLPSTIGLMLSALIFSSALIIAGQFGWAGKEEVLGVLRSIDFNRLLLNGMLGFLLFAGALNVELNELMNQKWVVASLATGAVVLSTLFVGVLTWLLLRLFEIPVSLMHCLLFGALISLTDPVAVLNILKTMKAPKALETQMAGEALFNDGVGVVIFMVLLKLATGDQCERSFHPFASQAKAGSHPDQNPYMGRPEGRNCSGPCPLPSVGAATRNDPHGHLYGRCVHGGSPGTDHRRAHEAVGEIAMPLRGFCLFVHEVSALRHRADQPSLANPY